MKINKQVVSMIASIFDPSGFLRPVTVKAKEFMQKLRRSMEQKDEEFTMG